MSCVSPDLFSHEVVKLQTSIGPPSVGFDVLVQRAIAECSAVDAVASADCDFSKLIKRSPF